MVIKLNEHDGYAIVDSIDDIKHYIGEYISYEFADMVSKQLEEADYERTVRENENKARKEREELESDGYLVELQNAHQEIDDLIDYMNGIETRVLGYRRFNNVLQRLKNIDTAILSVM